LEAQLAELEDRLHDLTKPPPPRGQPELPQAPPKKPTGKKPAGQPGHPPHLKQPVPPERVNQVVTYVPVTCDYCQAPLPPEPGPDDPEPVRHQVVELPDLTGQITEHQGHARTCPCCGKVTRATIPAAVRAHSVGAKLTSVLSYAGGHTISCRSANARSAGRT
jgi:transposase